MSKDQPPHKPVAAVKRKKSDRYLVVARAVVECRRQSKIPWTQLIEPHEFQAGLHDKMSDDS